MPSLYARRLNKTVWSKFVIADERDPNEIFQENPASTLQVSCVEETSGFAIWYSRYMSEEDPRRLVTKVKNGEYLLKFFHPDQRDEAIEFAVLVATKEAEGSEAAVRYLDHQIIGGLQLVQK
jgi:hypothetical protein